MKFKRILTITLVMLFVFSPIANAQIKEDLSNFKYEADIFDNGTMGIWETNSELPYDGYKVGPKTEAYINSFKTSADTPEGKIKDVVNYMINYNLKYSHNAGDTINLDSKKGNCHSLSVFAAKLFKKAGLPYKSILLKGTEKDGTKYGHVALITINDKGEPYYFESTTYTNLRDEQKTEEVIQLFINRGANQEQIAKDMHYNHNAKRYSELRIYITEWLNNGKIPEDQENRRKVELKKVDLNNGYVEYFKPINLKDVDGLKLDNQKKVK
ncbi:hypothetical protein [Fenollaria sporofastidiosus]|uniref:hypothetical protein n=1 Tax=Fenollaria sporofastidiosus TaxID=2811778 RepID=UPI001C006607|nr:hypothetical protein [Fenollaria sporofastidiosus]